MGFLQKIVPERIAQIRELCDQFPHYRLSESRLMNLSSSELDLVVLDVQVSLGVLWDIDFNFFKGPWAFSQLKETSNSSDTKNESLSYANFFILNEIKNGGVEAWLRTVLTGHGL